jgi:hypothetical protein
LEFSLVFSSGGTLTEGAVFARMVVSCTVEYRQLTICTVYSVVQLGPNPVHETSKPNLHFNCKVIGLVWAKVRTENTHQHKGPIQNEQKPEIGVTHYNRK